MLHNSQQNLTPGQLELRNNLSAIPFPGQRVSTLLDRVGAVARVVADEAGKYSVILDTPHVEALADICHRVSDSLGWNPKIPHGHKFSVSDPADAYKTRLTVLLSQVATDDQAEKFGFPVQVV